MVSSLFLILNLFVASAVAQSSVSVVCVAGQCLQGFSNVTIGAKVSAPGVPVTVQLLPGQYTSTTNPQLLHNLLTSSSTTLTPSLGFSNSTTISSLPLNLALNAGLAIYSQPLYAGQVGFSPLAASPAANTSTPLTASSLALSNNVWAAVSSTGSSSTSRVVLWDSVPDVSQLPAGTSASLSLLDIQSSACSPPCAGSGVCTSSGTCSCPTGFTGSSCETCAQGFFGPQCQPCPAGCPSCDQGITGSGRCLVPILPSNAPSTCNCLNGQCGSTGQCACNPGWTTSSNGTACAQCSPGFFLTSTGDCQVCEVGCTQCADGTGVCIACKNGFTQDENDKTKCDPVQSVTTSNTVCPDGSFGNGATCTACSPTCLTCSGATSNDCIICATGQYLFNGNCVSANSNGVCQGTNGMIADNNKHECDTCGAKCTSCAIPNFSVASTVNQLQCTGCLPGFVLSQGRCVQSCPSGTFVSPQDNLTCTPCSSSCGTCAGSADFCLTCTSSLLASNGKCVSTCPSGTFSSSNSCLSCHADCATCSGPSFTQCSTCPPDRPVLANGRCLPTCSKSQYFDKTSSSCLTCDSSCSSCSGSGPANCLGCASSSQVLRAGTCVAANCNAQSSVIPGLGVCLSDLVRVPSSSGSPAAMPSITGLSNPTIELTGRRALAWWEILLMALGCAFIFVIVLMLWRRKARKQRAKATMMFAHTKRLDGMHKGWRWRVKRFFGGGRGRKEEGEVLPVAYNHHELQQHTPRPVSLVSAADVRTGKKEMEDAKLRLISMDRKKMDALRAGLKAQTPRKTKSQKRETLDDVIDAYDYYHGSSRATSTLAPSRSSKAPSALPGLDDNYRGGRRIERDSVFSQLMGVPRRTAEPRQPVKDWETTRYSASTLGQPEGVLVDLEQDNYEQPPQIPPLQMMSTSFGASALNRSPTEAQKYVMTVRPGLLASPPASTALPTPFSTAAHEMPVPLHQGGFWPPRQPEYNSVVIQPTHTGGSRNNPFRNGAF